MSKSVCIVGAGPSGLVAAKVLRSTGKFNVTIYERSGHIGGIWRQDENGSKDSFLSQHTPVNVSRFNVGFSDLDWNSIDLAPRGVNGVKIDAPRQAPIFPKAWQANRYLKAFIVKHGLEEVVNSGHAVLKTDRYEHQDGHRWRVTVSAHGAESTTDFDYLILASGFFAKARPLSQSMTNISLSPDVRALHSSQFRNLGDLFAKPEDATGKSILVIGGSNSAGEAAAAVAQQLSNARYSPETGPQQLYNGTKIVHVTPRPIYILVPFAPVDEKGTTFIPWDLRMYELSRRPTGPVTGNAGRVPKLVKDMLHSAFQATLGGNQADLGSEALEVPPGEPRSPVQVALSESYAEFVRSGSIEVVAGRVTGLERNSAVVEKDGKILHLQDIGAVIYATGYTPVPAIDFLPDEVKEAVHYDDSSFRLPQILQGWQSRSSAVPDIAMIGLFEGPYWPLMEMQARLTASRWLNGESDDSRPYEEAQILLDLRRGMLERGIDIPQYWYGDYAGYLEEMAAHLKLKRNDGLFGEREGSVSPARYLSADTDQAQAKAIMDDLYSTWQDCTKNGKFVARAIFRALQGNWVMSRTIDSSLSSFPSGTLEGAASFHPRLPTKDKSGKTFDFEMLYIESGTLTLSNGASMTTRRRYVYRYSEARDELSVWFVKPDNDFEVDYLFHNLTFASPAEAEKAGACIAKADHLCVDDMYWTEYRLPMKAISLLEFTNTHTVKGPSKDYVATTTYRRPSKKAAQA